MTIKDIKKKTAKTFKRQGVEKAALFGSFVHGKEKTKSDIDFLVQMKKGSSLFDLAGLKIELEEKLGKEVDVITYHSLHPFLKDIILREQKIIYEKKH